MKKNYYYFHTILPFIYILFAFFNQSTAENIFFEIKKPKTIALNFEELFVSRQSWQYISDFAYANAHDGSGPANTAPFDPKEVPAGSIIFTNAFTLNDFFKEIHPKIKNPYIIITVYGSPRTEYANDPKIIAWFGMANKAAHEVEKFNIIPLGIFRSLSLFQNSHEFNQKFKFLRHNPKIKMLYMNFTLHTWSQFRRDVFNFFENKPYCVKSERKPFSEYMDEMSEFKFVLSPYGDLLDCYRHWEAIIVGSIPIIMSSYLDKVFEDLPVLIVDNYYTITEDFLNKKYEEMKNKKYNFRKLYMQYWIDKINETKQNFFKNNNLLDIK